MQSFHAVTYVTIVMAGLEAFRARGNWFFLVICTTFLFQGERILRKIFNLGSSFGTMKDLGETGLAVWGISKMIGNNLKSKKDKDSDEKDKDDEDEDEDDEESGESSESESSSQDEEESSSGSSSGSNIRPRFANIGKAQDVVNSEAEKVRESKARKIVRRVTGFTGGVGGAIVLGTFHLAAGSPEKAAASAIAGWHLGKGFANKFVSSPIIGVSNMYAGRKYKKAVLRGEYDKAFKKAGLDLSKVDEETAKLIRKALAEQQSAAIRRGETIGNYKLYKTLDEGNKK